MGRPPEKGGIFFKKNLGINPRQPDGKGQKKKKRKTLVLTLGSPLEKGGKKKPWSQSGFQDLDFSDLKPIIGTSTDGQTSELIK